ncbi:MAG: four helix bundle protein [Tidjanibacter sp.]|nr:four helix bundle protein [Tidjanibacter sp.]MBQ3071396.1 four helix bundle protein [Tidjanibacter sp.]MBR1958123.1 four helix bundle protein [Tidjanibacter sp.]
MNSTNIIAEKTKKFAIRIVKFAKFLRQEGVDVIIVRQLLKSGTSIGANTRESSNAQSKDDFIHKLSIALKEADETAYWLELLVGAEDITQKQFDSLNADLKEIIALLTSIIKTSKGIQ